MSEPDLLLRLEGVTKVYGRQKALDDVTFDLRAGEVHCLVGENGAGKSTLIKVLSGAVRPDAGGLHVMGGDFHTLDPRQAMALGIATIYQDVELIDSLTVADNIFLGCERTGALPGLVDARRQSAAARDIMDTLGIDIDERALVEDLPAAKQQMLQIVKALHGEAKVLIMDEPTSSLGLQETKALMQLVKDLRVRGVGVIYISHYIEEVFELGDRITVLKDGQVAGTHDVADVDHDTVVRQMVGREASAFFARRRVELGEVQFEVRGLSYGDAVQDVSFSVRCGEIFGIGGMVGSGRSELMHLIFGAARPQAGSVLLGGAEVTAGSPKQAMRSGICLVTEDRKASALLAGRSVLENVMVVSNELFGGPVLGIRRERRTVDGMVERLGIAVADREQDVLSLSGGNQQKAVIARWLLSEAKVFLFDEPTKGVDIGAKEQIYELMVELAEAGKSVVMISSDMPELLSMSDRIGVMRAGRLTHVLPTEDVSEEMLIQCFLGPG